MGAARKPLSDTTITMRVSRDAKRRLEQAAAIEGRSLTALVIDAANSRAIDVLLDRTVIDLSPEAAAAFGRALDDPPPPADALRRALNRKPVWE